MKKEIKFIVFVVILVIIIGGVGFFAVKKNTNNSDKNSVNLDSFAQCINDSGAKFYGTFWCSHCNNQKKMFGSSKKYLPYIECSTPDGQGQLDVCKQAGIEGYPTWVFADKSALSGELALSLLSEKTSCPLPQ